MRFKILMLIVTLAVSACQQATEVVEIKDEAGNVIEKIQLRKSDGIQDGFYKKYDENGKIIEEANYKDGKREGKRVIFYGNGHPMEEEHYENGILVGEVRSFYESGELKAITPYILKDGESVMEGTIKTFYKSGKIQAEATVLNSEISGSFTEYYESGIVEAKGAQKLDEDGFPRDHGLLELFDSTGQLVKKMECDMGWCKTTFPVEEN